MCQCVQPCFHQPRHRTANILQFSLLQYQINHLDLDLDWSYLTLLHFKGLRTCISGSGTLSKMIHFMFVLTVSCQQNKLVIWERTLSVKCPWTLQYQEQYPAALQLCARHTAVNVLSVSQFCSPSSPRWFCHQWQQCSQVWFVCGWQVKLCDPLANMGHIWALWRWVFS